MGTALTWQNGRQLATYGSGSKLVTYGYDGDGLRISKSGARNTEYIIVGGTYVGERTTINGTEYLIAYLYGDNGIVGINVNGTNYYFVKNLQGDITGIIDSAGNVVARYTYDAYGAQIDITDGDGNAVSPNNHTHIANLNPFRYRGYTYDQETGFYYLTTRYYDPYVGRFLNADAYVTTGQGFDGHNMFAYCNNNPVRYSDKSGKSAGEAVMRGLAAGIASLLDGPLPIADIIAIGVIAFLAGSAVAGDETISLPKYDFKEKDKDTAKEKEKEEVLDIPAPS